MPNFEKVGLKPLKMLSTNVAVILHVDIPVDCKEVKSDEK
jgi:hypothetical protein